MTPGIQSARQVTAVMRLVVQQRPLVKDMPIFSLLNWMLMQIPVKQPIAVKLPAAGAQFPTPILLLQATGALSAVAEESGKAVR